jgi:hypothetical protein
MQNSGRIAPREGEVVFRPINVIASEAKQSILSCCRAVDCFASLTMAWRETAASQIPSPGTARRSATANPA